MIHRTVTYAPEAEEDLLSLFDHIADAASEAVAAGYLGRVKVWLEGFSTASERGATISGPGYGLSGLSGD